MKKITGKQRNILLGAIAAGILLTGIVTAVLPEETEEVEMSVGTEGPVFHSEITQSLETGTYRLTDCISATDYNGNPLPVELTGMWYMDGEELTDCYDPVTKEISFERSGIYTLKLSAVDDMDQTGMCSVKVPVNNRKGEFSR